MNDSTISNIVDCIGQDAALKFMHTDNFGGMHYTFPLNEGGKGAQSFAHLAEIVGIEHARRLIKRFGGCKIYVPKLTLAMQHARNQRIVRDYESGKSIREIVREYQLSDRRVWDILKNTDMQQAQDGLQGSLF